MIIAGIAGDQQPVVAVQRRLHRGTLDVCNGEQECEHQHDDKDRGQNGFDQIQHITEEALCAGSLCFFRIFGFLGVLRFFRVLRFSGFLRLLLSVRIGRRGLFSLSLRRRLCTGSQSGLLLLRRSLSVSGLLRGLCRLLTGLCCGLREDFVQARIRVLFRLLRDCRFTGFRNRMLRML